MRSFRILSATAEGREVKSHFQAADITAAIKIAGHYLTGGKKVELWEGETLVTTVRADERAEAESS